MQYLEARSSSTIEQYNTKTAKAVLKLLSVHYKLRCRNYIKKTNAKKISHKNETSIVMVYDDLPLSTDSKQLGSALGTLNSNSIKDWVKAHECNIMQYDKPLGL